MRKSHNIATWTALLSIVTATGCIVAFPPGANPQSHVLIGAEAAATIGVVSLLLSVLVACFPALRRSGINLALWGSRGDQQAGDGVACLRKRREVLNQRLNIDEPRLCSQYMIPCTSWSFCGGSKDKSSAGEGTSPAAPELVHVRNLPSEAKGLPVVHRNGMDNCPFRFASLCAGSASADCVAPN
jgi:hypothetical protein